MTTQNVLSGITGSGGAADSAAAAAAAAAKKDPANKEMFLQLLVAQIKNQNPLSPTDGVQFLTQLAQFTQLEQSVGMREDLAAVRKHFEAVPSSADQTETKSATQTAP